MREHFSSLGARAHIAIWWNGAALDRLHDERHAKVVDRAVELFRTHGFRTETEFNEFGERGSIDIFAAHDGSNAVIVGEAKSEWGSNEETLRRQHMKVRLAPKLAERAFGWRPRSIASILLLPDLRTNRRIAQRFAGALAGYPARARTLRSWLHTPGQSIAGIWFLSDAGLVRPRDGADG